MASRCGADSTAAWNFMLPSSRVRWIDCTESAPSTLRGAARATACSWQIAQFWVYSASPLSGAGVWAVARGDSNARAIRILERMAIRPLRDLTDARQPANRQAAAHHGDSQQDRDADLRPQHAVFVEPCHGHRHLLEVVRRP